jgi:hypothetical protein
MALSKQRNDNGLTEDAEGGRPRLTLNAEAGRNHGGRLDGRHREGRRDGGRSRHDGLRRARLDAWWLGRREGLGPLGGDERRLGGGRVARQRRHQRCGR